MKINSVQKCMNMYVCIVCSIQTCIVMTGGLLILSKCFSILSSLKVLTCLVVFFRSKATTTGSENLWEERVRKKPKSRRRLSMFITFSAREKQIKEGKLPDHDHYW